MQGARKDYSGAMSCDQTWRDPEGASLNEPRVNKKKDIQIHMNMLGILWEASEIHFDTLGCYKAAPISIQIYWGSLGGGCSIHTSRLGIHMKHVPHPNKGWGSYETTSI